MSEKIIIFTPFAYMRLFEDCGTVQTRTRIYEVRKLFWRFFWVGFGEKV